MLYLAAGTAGGLTRVGDPPQEGGPTIYLFKGPIHTDLILPMTPEAREVFGFLEADGVTLSDWLIVGWGAAEFYTTTGTYADLEVGAVWRAIAGDSSVMRVHPIGPFQPNDHMTELTLSQAQFDILLGAVRAGFAGKDPMRVDVPGLTGRDHFYQGVGRFNALRTCNVWVGEVLRVANIRVGMWTPFTWSLP